MMPNRTGKIFLGTLFSKKTNAQMGMGQSEQY